LRKEISNSALIWRLAGRGFIWLARMVLSILCFVRPGRFYPDTQAEAEGVSKVFLFERMQHEYGCGYRFGYYILGKHGKWVWAEKPPMFNADDFIALLAQALREKVLLNDDIMVGVLATCSIRRLELTCENFST
jgi:hypothetical protein